jgi:hypothetical protein
VNLTPEVTALMTKARHALEVAEKLRAGGDLPDAAGKAYYAMFYAAQALLKAHGIEVTKHSAVALPCWAVISLKPDAWTQNFTACFSMPVGYGKPPTMASLKKLSNLLPILPWKKAGFL